MNIAMENGIRRMIKEEIDAAANNIIDKAVTKVMDQIKLEKLKEDNAAKITKTANNNETSGSKRLSISPSGQLISVTAENTMMTTTSSGVITEKQLNLIVDKKISTEVMPVIKTLANYIKVSLVDGDDVVTEYRRSQFASVKGEDQNTAAYKEIVSKLSRDGKLPAGTQAPRTQLDNILMLN